MEGKNVSKLPRSRLPQPTTIKKKTSTTEEKSPNETSKKETLPRSSNQKSVTSTNGTKSVAKNNTDTSTKPKNISKRTGTKASSRLYQTSTVSSRNRKPSLPSSTSTSDDDISVSATSTSPLSSSSHNILSKRVIELARKTGQLSLQNRNWTQVPDEVWNINQITPRDPKHGFSIDYVPDFDADTYDSEGWWNRKIVNKLSLANNNLTEISSDLSQLNSLIVLDVAHNQLKALPNSIGECIFLQRLIVSHNCLELLPESIGELRDLILLKVDNNCLKKLPKSFIDLGSVEEADLSHNQLETLPQNWLNGLRIRRLLLAHNKLQSIPSDIGWLQQLQILDLSQNNIGPQICNELGELRKLELLYLHGNKLEKLPILQQCSLLKELHVGSNRISELDDDFFDCLPMLKVVDFHDNKINTLPISLARLTCLERLNLERNDLSGIAPEISLIPTLKSLIIKDNPLRTLRRDIIQRGSAELIKYLKSRVNIVDEEVSPGLFDVDAALPRLSDIIRTRRLDLSGRSLTAIPDSLLDSLEQKDVYEVDLSNNQLNEIPEKLYNLASTLTDLLLTKNQFVSLPTQVGRFTFLNLLRIDVNRLSHLPSELENCERMRELDISHNRFTNLPEAIFSLKQLEVLRATGNKIEQIPAERICQLTMLTVLDFSSNEITFVPPELAKLKLKSLKLEGNAFKVPRASTLAKGTAEVLAYLRSRLPENYLLEPIVYSANEAALSLLQTGLSFTHIHTNVLELNKSYEVNMKSDKPTNELVQHLLAPGIQVVTQSENDLPSPQPVLLPSNIVTYSDPSLLLPCNDVNDALLSTEVGNLSEHTADSGSSVPTEVRHAHFPPTPPNSTLDVNNKSSSGSHLVANGHVVPVRDGEQRESFMVRDYHHKVQQNHKSTRRRHWTDPVDFEGILNIIGGCSWWQIWVYLLISLQQIPHSMFNLSVVYMMYQPDHWCNVSGLEINPNSNHGVNWTWQNVLQSNIAYPRETPNTVGGGKYGNSRCDYFNRGDNVYHELSHMSFENASARFPFRYENDTENYRRDRVTIRQCDQWYFDDQVMRETIVTEWNLVCGDNVKRAHAHLSYSLGYLAGCFLSGFSSDRFGRKPTVIGFGILSSMFGLILPYSTYFPMFLLIRFIGALCNEAADLAAYILCMEITGTKYRAMVGSLLQAPWAVGYALLSLVAYLTRSWRTMQIITAVLHTVSILLICVLPESPRWLIVNNRVREAEAIIRKACNMNKSGLPADLELVKHAEQRRWVKRNERANIFHLLKSRELLFRTCVIFVIWIATALVYYGLVIALSDQSAPGRSLFSGTGGAFFVNNAIAGAIELPTLLGCVFLMRFGRKRSQMVTLIGAGIFLLCAMFFTTSNQDEPSKQSIVLALMMMGKVCIQAAFNILYIFTSELYPTVIRNSAVGMSSLVARLGSGTASYVAILSDVTLPFVPMIIFAVFSLVAGTLVLFLPETRDQPLPDTLQDAVTFLKSENNYYCGGYNNDRDNSISEAGSPIRSAANHVQKKPIIQVSLDQGNADSILKDLASLNLPSTPDKLPETT